MLRPPFFTYSDLPVSQAYLHVYAFYPDVLYPLSLAAPPFLCPSSPAAFTILRVCILSPVCSLVHVLLSCAIRSPVGVTLLVWRAG